MMPSATASLTAPAHRGTATIRARARGDRALIAGGVVAAVLMAVSARYGFHRDELYFLQAGHHLAWGYPDQGPLVPAIARVTGALSGNALWALRLPSALAAGLCVVLAAKIAQELGAGRAARNLTATMVAVAPMTLAMGHLASTTTYDVTLSVTLILLLVRAVHREDARLLVPAGLLIGIGMLNKPLIGVLAVVLALALLASPHRRLLFGRWAVAGAFLAVAVAAPYLVWQAQHGWPQVAVGRAIAAGSSGTSEPRALFLPMQLLFVGPLLAPAWIAGLVALSRRPQLRPYRFVAGTFALFAAILLLSGAKPYYLAAMYPPLIAAGSESIVSWCRTRRRRWAGGFAVAATAVLSVMICLPLLPAERAAPIVAVNYDAGETIGWPTIVSEIAAVARRAAPADKTLVLTDNYGEAGAVDLYGPGRGVPAGYSGQNGFGYWPPKQPASDTTFVIVGMNREWLRAWYAEVKLAARLDNRIGINNDEQGTPVWICHNLRRPWPVFWSAFKHLG